MMAPNSILLLPLSVLLSVSFLTITTSIGFHPNLGRNAKLIIPHFQTLKSCKFDKIYQVGDSMADTGNLIRESPLGASSRFNRLPYGQDFDLHRPSGRCSNGLLMIDYIASAAGLPLVNPYKDVDANFTHGANFAVAGATALPSPVLEARNISNPLTNTSLDVQLQWMSTHFNSICHTYKDCAEKLKNALFLVGEIGGNDYNYAFGKGMSIEEVKYMVPEVVQVIKKASTRLIQHGAVWLVIPGDFPTGCFPVSLTAYQTGNASAYDKHHCLKDHNEFSVYHNDHIKKAIKELKQEFPNTTIVYGDYYKAFQWLLQKARHLGFDQESALKACCGVGGNYNYDSMRKCGTSPSATVCEDPNVRISWDGVHLTQAAYKNMAKWLLISIIPQLKCSAFIPKEKFVNLSVNIVNVL